MTIYGIGCDIIEISRIEAAIKKFGQKFLVRIFTKVEIELSRHYAIDSNLQPLYYYRYFAKRYAAKEAFAKALGTGIGRTISFNEIEILNNQFGKPYINPIIELPNILKNLVAHLSLSDDKNMAMAYVILENRALD